MKGKAAKGVHALSQADGSHTAPFLQNRQGSAPPTASRSSDGSHHHPVAEEPLRRFVHDAILPVLIEFTQNMQNNIRSDLHGLSNRVRQDLRKEFLHIVDDMYSRGFGTSAPGSSAARRRSSRADPEDLSMASASCLRQSAIAQKPASGSQQHRPKYADRALQDKFKNDEKSPKSDGKSGQYSPLDMVSSLPSRQKDSVPRKKPLAIVQEPPTDDDPCLNRLDMLPNELPPLLPLHLEGQSTRVSSSPSSPSSQADKAAGLQADKAAGTPASPSATTQDDDVETQGTAWSLPEVNDRQNTAPPKKGGASAIMKNRLSLSKEAARADRKGKPAKPFWQMSATEVLHTSTFDNFIGCVIILNAITIGATTDYLAQNMTDIVPMHFSVFEYVFLVLFTSELSLRIYVYRCAFFYMKEGRLWNWFDLFVVTAQITEEVMLIVARSSNIQMDGKLASSKLMRIMRILRLMRILRVMRVLRLISELRTIVSSIAGSMKSLGWTLVLLLLMIYIVGVYFTQTISEHMVDRSLQDDTPFNIEEVSLNEYFGSLARTILTLYQAMSGGVDWDSLASPLIHQIGWSLGLALACYVAFALLALMNVVTGVFVQTALQSAKDEEDAFLTDQVIGLFRATSNEDESHPCLCWSEVEQALHDPKQAAFWNSIDVRPEEAKYLFFLLDIDNSGEVEFEEFLSGCLRLRGPAKSIDLLTVMQEDRSLARKCAQHFSNVEQRLELLQNVPWIEESVSRIVSDVGQLQEVLEEDQLSIRILKRNLQDVAASQHDMQMSVRGIRALDNLLGPFAENPESLPAVTCSEADQLV